MGYRKGVILNLRILMVVFITAVVLFGLMSYIQKVDIGRVLKGNCIIDGECDFESESIETCPEDCAEPEAWFTLEHVVLEPDPLNLDDKAVLSPSDMQDFLYMQGPDKELCHKCSSCSECWDTQEFVDAVKCKECSSCDELNNECDFCENCTSASSDYSFDDIDYKPCGDCFTCSECIGEKKTIDYEGEEFEYKEWECGKCEACESCEKDERRFSDYNAVPYCDYCSFCDANDKNCEGCLSCHKPGESLDVYVHPFNQCGECSSCVECEYESEPFICEVIKSRLEEVAKAQGLIEEGAISLEPIIVYENLQIEKLSGEKIEDAENRFLDELKRVLKQCKPEPMMKTLDPAGRQYIGTPSFELSVADSKGVSDELLSYVECGPFDKSLWERGKIYTNTYAFYEDAPGFSANLVLGNTEVFNNDFSFNLFACFQPAATRNERDPVLEIYYHFADFDFGGIHDPMSTRAWSYPFCFDKDGEREDGKKEKDYPKNCNKTKDLSSNLPLGGKIKYNSFEFGEAIDIYKIYFENPGVLFLAVITEVKADSKVFISKEYLLKMMNYMPFSSKFRDLSGFLSKGEDVIEDTMKDSLVNALGGPGGGNIKQNNAAIMTNEEISEQSFEGVEKIIVGGVYQRIAGTFFTEANQYGKEGFNESTILYNTVEFDVGENVYSAEQVAEIISAGIKDWNGIHSQLGLDEANNLFKKRFSLFAKPDRVYFTHDNGWVFEEKSNLNVNCWSDDFNALYKKPEKKRIYYAKKEYTGIIKVRTMIAAYTRNALKDRDEDDKTRTDIEMFPVITIC